MKPNSALAGFILILLSGCAHHPSARAIKSQCRLEMEAARTAVKMREQGKTKTAMLQSLPSLHPDSTRLLFEMHQIVDEAYAFPALNDIVYGIYRFETCARQLQHQLVSPPFQELAPHLLACQEQYRRQVSKAAVACVRGVFPARPKSSNDTKTQVAD